MLCTTFVMVASTVATLAVADFTYTPWYANESFQPARTLHPDWANLTIETNTGSFIGFYNDTYPDVRQFLRIPFAQVRALQMTRVNQISDPTYQPPVGNLRWMPPVKPVPSNKTIDSTRFGPGAYFEELEDSPIHLN